MAKGFPSIDKMAMAAGIKQHHVPPRSVQTQLLNRFHISSVFMVLPGVVILTSAGVCEKTLLRRRGPLGKSAWKTPNQGLDSSFCCWIARPRLVQKECFVHRQTPVSYHSILYYTIDYYNITQHNIIYTSEAGASACEIFWELSRDSTCTRDTNYGMVW